jgi:DNA replication protein DnaC
VISELQENLRTLRCHHMANALEDILAKSNDNDVSYLDFIRDLIQRELEERSRTKLKQRTKQSQLPCDKYFEDFDFAWQTSITKRQVKGWLDFDWIDNRINRLFLGPSGVGKSHLALALSREALRKGYRVRYFSMSSFVEEMIHQEETEQTKKWIKKLLLNDLIVLDELGYLPVNRSYTHLFFRFINECYEYRSLIITSNKMPSQWGKYFGDESVAMAILDRLMHHSDIVVLNGDSYRLKDKLATLNHVSEKFTEGTFSLAQKPPL